MDMYSNECQILRIQIVVILEKLDFAKCIVKIIKHFQKTWQTSFFRIFDSCHQMHPIRESIWLQQGRVLNNLQELLWSYLLTDVKCSELQQGRVLNNLQELLWLYLLTDVKFSEFKSWLFWRNETLQNA